MSKDQSRLTIIAGAVIGIAALTVIVMISGFESRADEFSEEDLKRWQEEYMLSLIHI